MAAYLIAVSQALTPSRSAKTRRVLSARTAESSLRGTNCKRKLEQGDDQSNYRVLGEQPFSGVSLHRRGDSSRLAFIEKHESGRDSGPVGHPGDHLQQVASQPGHY